MASRPAKWRCDRCRCGSCAWFGAPVETGTGRRGRAGLVACSSIVELGTAVLEAKVDDHERLASYSAPLRHICSHKGCLSRDPDARPTASGLLSSRWGVRTMRAFLSHKHISKPPAKLISLVKERVLLAAAAQMLEGERKLKARTRK